MPYNKEINKNLLFLTKALVLIDIYLLDFLGF